MILTHEYRPVQAVFEEHQNIPELKQMIPRDHSRGIWSKFQVGVFEYSVLIGPTRDPDTWVVSFELFDINGTPDQLAREFSKIWKQKVSAHEAEVIKQRLLNNSAQGRTRTGRSSEVLGNVLSIVNEFIVQYHPKCLRFSALEPSRQDLYRSMIKRFLPDWKSQETGNTFTVCQRSR